MAKKYALVRVDDNCPFMQEKLDFSSCSKMFNCDKFIRCEKCEHNCRYGDTKEQLIRKIITVFMREKYLKLGIWQTHNMANWRLREELAKEIVEFLGVEE